MCRNAKGIFLVPFSVLLSLERAACLSLSFSHECHVGSRQGGRGLHETVGPVHAVVVRGGFCIDTTQLRACTAGDEWRVGYPRLDCFRQAPNHGNKVVRIGKLGRWFAGGVAAARQV